MYIWVLQCQSRPCYMLWLSPAVLRSRWKMRTCNMSDGGEWRNLKVRFKWKPWWIICQHWQTAERPKPYNNSHCVEQNYTIEKYRLKKQICLFFFLKKNKPKKPVQWNDRLKTKLRCYHPGTKNWISSGRHCTASTSKKIGSIVVEKNKVGRSYYSIFY